jgi:nitrite reductase/ring-hydroxylating ferredoxin subunit
MIGLAFVAGLGSLITGLTEIKDTTPNSTTRDVTILHGLINSIGMGGFAFSTMQRLDGNHDAGFWGLIVGYLLIGVGGYIGGHLVFKYGYSVNFNAFSKGKRAREFTAVLPAAELPENTPTKATLGATAVVLVRRGDVVHALKETCSHAGGPLSQGTLRGDTIECPWHASVFRLADGSVVHGPAASRQVSYRARINGDRVELQGPHD